MGDAPSGGAGVPTSDPETRLRVVIKESFDADLTERVVGDIRGHFFIPDYQRGYRWGTTEVGHLLNDVLQHVRSTPDDRYLLQPVVVKRLGEDRWELIDGQQRLTTLYLILKVIHTYLPHVGPGYTLEYETRQARNGMPGSAEFLDDPESAPADINIDFFHIAGAHEFIRKWFQETGDPTELAMDVYNAFRKAVRVIWYEVADVDAKKLFVRLNVGRILLTDAELVKALLLAEVRRQLPDSGRAHEIAAQWDAIEKDLRNPELWAFVTASPTPEATHIRLLLDTLADRVKDPGEGRRPLFHTFETLREQIVAEPLEFWNRVQDLHSLLLGWWEDLNLFHHVGFLTATGQPFESIVRMSKGLTRTKFQAALNNEIRRTLRLTETQLTGLLYSRKAKCLDVLLLMNVETTRLQPSSSERYSFREHARHSWSLEHIHAQHSAPFTREDQWRRWLEVHRDALRASEIGEASSREALVTEIDAVLAATPIIGERFRQLEARVTEVFTADGSDDEFDVHSISNLALIALEANSFLNNAVFEVKRSRIVEMDRAGEYIPPCTRKVFLKYYTSAVGQQIHFWSQHDREGYLEEMVRLLGPYLEPGNGADE